VLKLTVVAYLDQAYGRSGTPSSAVPVEAALGAGGVERSPGSGLRTVPKKGWTWAEVREFNEVCFKKRLMAGAATS